MLRQRSLALLSLQHCSTDRFHGAPAHCTSGRRLDDHLPPPGFRQSRSTCQSCRAAPDLGRQQCTPPLPLPTSITATAWRQSRQSTSPGRSALTWSWPRRQHLRILAPSNRLGIVTRSESNVWEVKCCKHRYLKHRAWCHVSLSLPHSQA